MQGSGLFCFPHVWWRPGLCWHLGSLQVPDRGKLGRVWPAASSWVVREQGGHSAGWGWDVGATLRGTMCAFFDLATPALRTEATNTYTSLQRVYLYIYFSYMYILILVHLLQWNTIQLLKNNKIDVHVVIWKDK